MTRDPQRHSVARTSIAAALALAAIPWTAWCADPSDASSPSDARLETLRTPPLPPQHFTPTVGQGAAAYPA